MVFNTHVAHERGPTESRGSILSRWAHVSTDISPLEWTNSQIFHFEVSWLDSPKRVEMKRIQITALRAIQTGMTFVEHWNLRSVAWARDLDVTKRPRSLVIQGKMYCEPVLGPAAGADLFESFNKARASTQKGHTACPPHIEFANAEGDDALEQFVRRYGPVFADTLADGARGVIATQQFSTLRKEQEIFKCTMELVRELKKEADADAKRLLLLANRISLDALAWPTQWEKERTWRLRYFKGQDPEGWASPRWTTGQVRIGNVRTMHKGWVTHDVVEKPEDVPILEALQEKFGATDARTEYGTEVALEARSWGWYMVSGLLNAFPTVIQYSEGKIREVPAVDLLFGVRPALYGLLRLDVMDRGYRTETCGNQNCRKLFAVERLRQKFCCIECSRLQRGRDYWRRKGKEGRYKRREISARHACDDGSKGNCCELSGRSADTLR